MTRFLLGQLLLALCVSASAQAIYKWTDSAGHVHYGDRNDANGSASSTLNAPRQASQPDAGKVMVQEPIQAAASDSPDLPRCLALARVMADDQVRSASVIRARSKELLSLCPDTAYECTSFPKQPERNTCKAVVMVPNGGIVTNRTYN
jgi:hypothetical protein